MENVVVVAANSSNCAQSTEIKNKYYYGQINLTLENCILPPEKLIETPSFVDGLSEENEYDLRILGADLIQSSGILLKLPQVAMATGQVLFHRFYYSKSFVRYPMKVTAMACITLASKIEEAPRRIRDVINVFHHMKQIRTEKKIQPLILDQEYINLKNQVIKAERRLLKELGFCVHVKHPHKVLDSEKNHRLMQTAWNYMNDSLKTDVFIRYSPETIAVSCIYLSSRVLRIPLPSKPAWFEIFGVKEAEIQTVCRMILYLYTRGQPNQEELEEIVNNLKKEYEKMKQKARGLIENGTNANKLENDSKTSPVVKQGVVSPVAVEKNDRNESDRIGGRNSSLSPKKSMKNRRSRSRSKSRSRSQTPIKYQNVKWPRSRSRSASPRRVHGRGRSRSQSPSKYHHSTHHHSHHNSKGKRSQSPSKHRKHRHHRYESSSHKSSRPRSRDSHYSSKVRSRSPRR